MTLEILLAHPAVQALGRALLHFLWQGSLLALFLWIVKTIAPSSAARLRYAAASLIMLMMPIALIVTATWNSHSEPGGAAAVPRLSIQAPAHMLERLVYYVPASSAPARRNLRMGRVHLVNRGTAAFLARRRRLDGRAGN